MESLLCDEICIMSPSEHKQDEPNNNSEADNRKTCNFFYTTKEDCELAFQICLENEMSYMPQQGYKDFLKSNDLIAIARSKCLQCFCKSRWRLNLSFDTVFCAANCFDRFISLNQCRVNGWKYWIMELLSVACLSVASKFGETIIPPLHEIQMMMMMTDGLEQSFQPRMIQRMELTVLKTLEWKLNSITTYSYVGHLVSNINEFVFKPHLLQELISRFTELLLLVLLEPKFLEYRPCVIAVSALQYILDQEMFPSRNHSHIAHLTALIPLHHKDDLMECHKTMDEALIPEHMCSSTVSSEHSCNCQTFTPNPVTILTVEPVDTYDCQVDASLIFKMPVENSNFRSVKKSKREKE